MDRFTRAKSGTEIAHATLGWCEAERAEGRFTSTAISLVETNLPRQGAASLPAALPHHRKRPRFELAANRRSNRMHAMKPEQIARERLSIMNF